MVRSTLGSSPTAEPNPDPADPEVAVAGPLAQTDILPSPMLPERADAEKPLPFNQNAYRWNRGRYSRNRRFIDIWSFVLRLLGARWRYGKA